MKHKERMGDPPSDNEGNIEDEYGLEPDDFDVQDMEEVYELGGAPGEEGLAVNMDDMGLEAAGEDGDEEGAAAMVQRDDAVTVFAKHTGSVFCVGIEPKQGELAVTGGEDDKAYVWNISDGQVLFECTGHKDSVTAVDFSHDGTYVATGDMAGTIKVWKTTTKKEVWSFDVSDLEWMQWHHGAHVLFAGTVDGEVWMWKIPSGDCKTFPGHGCPANSGRLLPDGKRLCVGYEDGSIKVWDLKAASPVHTLTGHGAHESSITSMDCHHDNTVVATGSTDETAKLFNTVTGKVLATFNCKSDTSQEEENSVEAVGFCSVNSVLATGNLTGSLTFWDMSSNTERLSCQHEAGITRLKWAADSPLVYTATVDGAVSLWDSRSGKMEYRYLGHKGEILDLAISRDGSHLVTGSDDQTARVFNTSKPDR